MSKTTLKPKQERLRIFLDRAYSQIQRTYKRLSEAENIVNEYARLDETVSIRRELEEFELLDGMEIEELLK